MSFLPWAFLSAKRHANFVYLAKLSIEFWQASPL